VRNKGIAVVVLPIKLLYSRVSPNNVSINVFIAVGIIKKKYKWHGN
jgi:hypothetical protein